MMRRNRRIRLVRRLLIGGLEGGGVEGGGEGEGEGGLEGGGGGEDDEVFWVGIYVVC